MTVISTAVMLCDKCDARLTQDPDETRRDFIERSDALNWTGIRRSGQWQNVCPECIPNNGGN